MSELTAHLREEEIVPFLDGCLETADRRRVESHLDACEACRTHLAELRSVLDELDEWKTSDPDPSFDAVVRERLAAETGAETAWWSWAMRPAWGISLVVLLFVAGGVGIWLSSPAEGGLEPGAVIVSAPEEVDALFDAAMEGGDVPFPGETQSWMGDYELIQEFDALFEDNGNGSSQL